MLPSCLQGSYSHSDHEFCSVTAPPRVRNVVQVLLGTLFEMLSRCSLSCRWEDVFERETLQIWFWKMRTFNLVTAAFSFSLWVAGFIWIDLWSTNLVQNLSHHFYVTQKNQLKLNWYCPIKKTQMFTCLMGKSSVLKEDRISFWEGVLSRKANKRKMILSTRWQCRCIFLTFLS